MSAVPARTWPPDWNRVLVVVAHPDDESFALGALLDRLVQDGADVAMLCLTRGEASTLGAGAGDLAAVRADELAAAGEVLGMASTTALTHPDGGLATVDPAVLAADIDRHVERTRPDGILVFDPASGVTGHPDHAAASLAAIAAAERWDLPVLGWALPQSVADALNAEYGAAFVGYPADALLEVVVDRRRQRMAIACHASQAVPGSVLWRRLELLGDREYLRTQIRHPNPRRTAVNRRSTAALVLAAVVAATLATSGCSGSADSTVAVSAGPTASAAPTAAPSSARPSSRRRSSAPGTTIVDVRTPAGVRAGTPARRRQRRRVLARLRRPDRRPSTRARPTPSTAGRATAPAWRSPRWRSRASPTPTTSAAASVPGRTPAARSSPAEPAATPRRPRW